MFAAFLLPDKDDLALDRFQVEDQDKTITVYVSTTQPGASCPTCHEVSEHVHSHYRRTLLDLLWADYAVHLCWTVRRFFCDNQICKSQTFAEGLSAVAARYGRKTHRRLQKQCAVAFESGGEPGQRLVAIGGFPASADSLLRLIRANPLPPASTPRVLGVDDWALRKGQIYGTILIDLETHRPIDLLRERSAETLATWLKQHPGIEIISRDRSSEYAKGATQGAPLAIQVADRWHLLNNFREAVVAYLEQHRAGLAATAKPAPSATVDNTPAVPADPVLSSEITPGLAPASSTSSPIAPSSSTPVPETASSEVSATPSSSTKPEQIPSRKSHRLSQARRTKRLERYQEVLELHRQGHSIREIAERLHLGRQTVKKFVRADTFPERASRSKRVGKLTPYEPYLQARWDEGCHNALQLFREIQAEGYTGSRLLVSMWAAPRRDQPRVRKGKANSASSKPKLPPIGEPAWSAKRAAWLVVLETTGLKREEQEILERMKQADANLDMLNRLALDFRSMVRDRDVTKLADWMARAKASAIDVLQGFVRGLELDLKAVEAALKYPWSNGPTEGHVNRLKTIKRQMYGRANFDLLRRRVLGPPAVSQ